MLEWVTLGRERKYRSGAAKVTPLTKFRRRIPPKKHGMAASRNGAAIPRTLLAHRRRCLPFLLPLPAALGLALRLLRWFLLLRGFRFLFGTRLRLFRLLSFCGRLGSVASARSRGRGHFAFVFFFSRFFLDDDSSTSSTISGRLLLAFFVVRRSLTVRRHPRRSFLRKTFDPPGGPGLDEPLLSPSRL